jgi:hypothetical protein
MNRIIIPLLLAILTLNVQAAPKNDRDCPCPNDLASRLRLDSKQDEKLEAMMAKHREAMDKLRDEHEKRHREDKEAMQALWASQRQDIATILTPTQLATFDKLAKHRPHPPRNPDAMSSGTDRRDHLGEKQQGE